MLLTDDRLPGGSAGGKVTGYLLEADGDGRLRAEVRIGCSIGTGATVEGSAGTPTWVEDGYVDGYQAREGASLMPIAGEVTYADVSGTPVVDDGIDFLNLRPADLLLRFDVTNGEAVQRGVLAATYPDIAAAVAAINAAHTEVCIELRPLIGGSFETTYDVTLSPLMVPRTITL